MFQRYLINCAVCAVVVANSVAAAQNPLENGASFTPEGTIIHHWHDRQTGGLVEIDLEGNRLREITATTHQDRWPKVGANGREIVFVSTRDGTWSVFAVAREGGEVRQITDNYVMNLGGAVSPDGEWLLVAQNRQQEEFYSDIFLSRPDGSARRRIVEGGMWPNWLADGSGFIFTRDNGESGALDVILYRLEDGQEIRLTERLENDVSAVVSPDGRWLYYAQGEDARFVLHRRPLAGGDDENLGVPMNIDSGPAISPDGRYMVYGYNAGSGYDLYRLDLQTLERVQLTRPDTSGSEAE